MKAALRILKAAAWAVLFTIVAFPAGAQSNSIFASAPIYAPDFTHANQQIPPGVLNWDATQKTVDVTNGQDFARFVFSFTNAATKPNLEQITNILCSTHFETVTNRGFWNHLAGVRVSTITNIQTNAVVALVTNGVTPDSLVILSVKPSCGCTTAELPTTPWFLPPGTNSAIRLAVNLAGKQGMLFKTVHVATERGFLDLMLRINIQPAPPPRPLTDAERAAGVAASTVNRQAIFTGECATCHNNNLKGKYGQQLFAAACSICHEANPRATMVPDLHNLKDPTNEEFWRAWVTSGKAGTLMPAFSNTQGGPLDDMQIASLAVYLNSAIPSRVPPTNAK